MDKLVVTKYNNKILQAYYEDGRLMELELSNEESSLENIYIGKVANILSDIDACFIDYGEEKPCYYSINENRHIFLNKKTDNIVRIGDELLIQISRDAVKTKNPVATSLLSLRGEYCIVDMSGKIGISAKITSSKKRDELKKLALEYLPENMGCIIRTAAKDCDYSKLTAEIEKLAAKLQSIIKKAENRTCFSCLYKKTHDYLDSILLKNVSKIGEIVTDDAEIYDNISEYIKELDVNNIDIRLFSDDMCSLMTTYNLNREIENALKDKVWMKSGAYLVIQQTEAMVVVDVNTGKSVTNKNINQHMLNVNIEAAKETCRQLRLRNLSGIIIIDFINMKSPSDIEMVRDILINELKRDTVPSKFVDITKLGLIEITRKKIKRPLKEMIS